MTELSDFHIQKICRAVSIRVSDIDEVRLNSGGLNNETWIIRAGERCWIYRIPGEKTSLFCDREQEARTYQTLAPYHISDEVVFLEPDTGLKLSVYYPESHTSRTDDETELSSAMALIKRFHSLPVTIGRPDSNYERLLRYEQAALHNGVSFGEDFLSFRPLAEKYNKILKSAGHIDCPAHGDFIPENVLFRKNDRPILLDFEFSTMGDPYEDIAAYCLHSRFEREKADKVLSFYLGQEPEDDEKQRLYMSCVTSGLFWHCWSELKCAMTNQNSLYVFFSKMTMDCCRLYSQLVEAGD